MTLDEIADKLSAIHDGLARAHPPQVMTTEEAAAFLGVTPETLFRYRKDAIGPKYSRINDRVIRYLHDDLVAWMKEHR